MKKLTILIDMDDVLEELGDAWVTELNRTHGTSVLPSDITSWKIADFFPTLTEDEVYQPLHDPKFWSTLVPTQNAQKIVKRLMDDGHTIRIVTASHYNTVAPKIAWLLGAYPYLRWKDIIIASDKSMICGDVMIDDGVHNLECTHCAKLLFDRYHNHTYKAEENGMIRVKNWDEIYSIISNMAGGIE